MDKPFIFPDKTIKFCKSLSFLKTNIPAMIDTDKAILRARAVSDTQGLSQRLEQSLTPKGYLKG